MNFDLKGTVQYYFNLGSMVYLFRKFTTSEIKLSKSSGVDLFSSWFNALIIQFFFILVPVSIQLSSSPLGTRKSPCCLQKSIILIALSLTEPDKELRPPFLTEFHFDYSSRTLLRALLESVKLEWRP